MMKTLGTAVLLLLLARQATAQDEIHGAPINAPAINGPSVNGPPVNGPPVSWNRWRGPQANGVADGQDLPVRWSRTENIVWSAQLPGSGTSSPVVYGDRVFVTSQVDDGGKKRLLTLSFDPPTGPA